MSRRSVFKLAPSAPNSQDTIACLEAMLEDARRGEMIGIAASAMYRNRRYVFHACGEAHRSPTFTAGMLEAFVGELVDRIRHA